MCRSVCACRQGGPAEGHAPGPCMLLCVWCGLLLGRAGPCSRQGGQPAADRLACVPPRAMTPLLAEPLFSMGCVKPVCALEGAATPIHCCRCIWQHLFCSFVILAYCQTDDWVPPMGHGDLRLHDQAHLALFCSACGCHSFVSGAGWQGARGTCTVSIAEGHAAMICKYMNSLQAAIAIAISTPPVERWHSPPTCCRGRSPSGLC